jgi:hypothetical protein
MEPSDGKEGVDGSSPSEGFSFLPAQSSLSFLVLTPTGSLGVHRASTRGRGDVLFGLFRPVCERPAQAGHSQFSGSSES